MLNVCKFPGLLSVTPSGFVTLSSKNLFPKVSMYFKLLTSKEIHAKGPEAFHIKSTFSSNPIGFTLTPISEIAGNSLCTNTS